MADEGFGLILGRYKFFFHAFWEDFLAKLERDEMKWGERMDELDINFFSFFNSSPFKDKLCRQIFRKVE